jgi:hypothetical protein
MAKKKKTKLHSGNLIAKELRTPLYHMRVEVDKTKYNRKKRQKVATSDFFSACLYKISFL